VKTLEEKIKVMQAMLDGKPIEMKAHACLVYNTWNGIRPPNFNWDLNDYRIKEEPKKKIKLYQALLHYKDSMCYQLTPQLYKTVEQVTEIYKHSNYEVIKLLPHTEIEVEIDNE